MLTVTNMEKNQPILSARSSLPILSEKTQLCTQSELSECIEKYYRDVVRIPPKRLLKTQTKVERLVRYVFPRMKKNAIKLGLRLKAPIFTGSTYSDLYASSIEEVDVLLPFDKERTKIDAVDPGYVVIPLRRHRQVRDLDDPWRFGRSVDGLYLSPIQVSRTMHELLRRALTIPVEVPNVVLEPLFDGGRHPRIRVLLGNHLKINVIPAIVQDDTKPILISRCYKYDQNPNSDMLWRLFYREKEDKILSLMDQADRGRRRKALKIMKTLFSKEYTLHGITSYHLKTVLFHTFDAEVDETPRWQRDVLETCILSLFRDLLSYLNLKSLPHFFQRENNLFENVPPRTLTKLRNRVAYIVSNENELVRILRKREDIFPSKTPRSIKTSGLLGVDHRDGLRSDSSIPSTDHDAISSISSFPENFYTRTHAVSDESIDSYELALSLNS